MEIPLPSAPVPIALVGLAIWLVVARVKTMKRPAQQADVVDLVQVVEAQERRIRDLEQEQRRRAA